MRKALRIIAIAAGIISILSTVILGFVYLEDFFGQINKIKSKISNKISESKRVDDEFDSEWV